MTVVEHGNPFPNVATPSDVHEAQGWCDIGTSTGAWRSIHSQRLGIDRHFVEAHGTQEQDGSVSEACVRAKIDAWGLNHFEDWDTMNTPTQARAKAQILRGKAGVLMALADAFDVAADVAAAWSDIAGGPVD